MRIGGSSAGLCVTALMLVGCALPTAHDVVIHGHVADASGSPAAGVKIYIVDLKVSLGEAIINGGMEGVGEHVTVYTNEHGDYSAPFRKLHSAVSITVSATPPCPAIISDFATIPSKVYAGTHDLRRDFVYCAGPANNRWRGP
jgi:hypothetical protein